MSISENIPTLIAHNASFDSIDDLVSRSEQLSTRLFQLVLPRPRSSSERDQCAASYATLSFEHSQAIVASLIAGCPSSAIALVRLQFEAMTRAMWVAWVAPEHSVKKLMAPLDLDSERLTKRIPMAADMIKEIGLGIGAKVPSLAHSQLLDFKQNQLPALNSYVHAGIHPLRRHIEGCPMPLVVSVVRGSNALALMAGMLIAGLTGDASVVRRVGRLDWAYRDCLPPRLPYSPIRQDPVPSNS